MLLESPVVDSLYGREALFLIVSESIRICILNLLIFHLLSGLQVLVLEDVSLSRLALLNDMLSLIMK